MHGDMNKVAIIRRTYFRMYFLYNIFLDITIIEFVLKCLIDNMSGWVYITSINQLGFTCTSVNRTPERIYLLKILNELNRIAAIW